jgi:hypothetical protein
MAGVLEMSPGERVARLAEGTAVIDRLLRGNVTPFRWAFHAVRGGVDGARVRAGASAANHDRGQR